MPDKEIFVLKIVWKKSIASLHRLTQAVQRANLRRTAGDPTSIYIVALGVGLKCPREIHLYTQWGGDCSIPERFEVKCLKFPPYLWIMVAFSGFNYPSYAMR